ncbi:MAG: ASCH domain-containing protein [Thaumarchaeota archaeon]|nr:ASCH domain-containing protein [Nitrososphaerota archaeon]
MKCSSLIDTLSNSVKDDAYWNDFFKIKNRDGFPTGIHLAVFVEPYLTFILQGKKTVESRFSSNRIAPYQKVNRGDIIILKRSGGPIFGLCEISEVWSYLLDAKSWKHIKKEFTISLCAQDPNFWSQRSHASYATLMRIKNVSKIEPINWKKNDRRGWVVLHNKTPDNR